MLRAGRREIDASLVTLLRQLRETMEVELAEELFPEAEARAGEEEAGAGPR